MIGLAVFLIGSVAGWRLHRLVIKAETADQLAAAIKESGQQQDKSDKLGIIAGEAKGQYDTISQAIKRQPDASPVMDADSLRKQAARIAAGEAASRSIGE